MLNRSVLSAVALIVLSLVHAPAHAAAALIRTVDLLDEPRGYCLDIPGIGPTIRLEDALQAHTCKYGEPMDDQLFERTLPGSQLRSPGFNRCLTPSALDAGAQLKLAQCTGGDLQRWTLSWDTLRPMSRPDLCVSLARESQVTGTPALVAEVYRRRAVTLQRCAEYGAALQSLRFSTPGELELESASPAHTGMPAEIAAAIRGFGRAFNGDIVRQTRQLLASAPKSYSPDELDVVTDVSYGPNDAQRLDVYTAKFRSADTPMPVVIIFHGGGLVGGSRSTTANAAEYLASLGFVGVNGTYRRAPESKWPDGGRDVALAVSWLHENAAQYGGNPEQIFVMGLSTGALHAATYVFRPDLLPAGSYRAAGAMLLSGPYTFDFDNPTEGELAYFGADASRYPEMVVTGNVSATDIPVLLTTAEWDIARYTIPFTSLLTELISEHGVVPRYAQNPGHNHVSQVLAIGTADRTVSSLLIDFIEQTLADD